MDIERALVSKLIRSGQLHDAVSNGVREDLFADPDMQDMFLFIQGHFRKYGEPPSIQAVQDQKPDFEFEHTSDPLDYLVDRFKVNAKRRMADDMLLELATACNDPLRAESIDLEFLEVSRKLATLVPSSRVNLFKEGMQMRIEEYEKLAKEKKLPGVPFGIPTLDYYTGGIQPHEFVVVAGFSGLGKSTMLMLLAWNIFMQGKVPLYISLEMEHSALLRRWDAMAASLDYRMMKQLQLPEEQIQNWKETREKILEMPGEIPVIDSIRNCTPDAVYAETVRHKPDVVIVDYVSLMRSGRATRSSSMWQNITDITQDLKQNARVLGIPIIAAAQTNRAGAKEGAELDNVGYSLSITQDPDIVLGLFRDEEMKRDKLMRIRLNKNRDGPLNEFDMIWDFETMTFRQREQKDKFGPPGPHEPKPRVWPENVPNKIKQRKKPTG